jgi:hypothetical protein
MASSVTGRNSGPGVVTTAFYTGKQDSVLIVNPTSTSYSHLMSFSNLGLSAPTATLYQVVNGKSISHASLPLKQTGSSYSANVTIPPYTVIGIALR